MTSNQRIARLPGLLREAERRVNAHVFKQPGDSALCSIPANHDRDVDLLLIEAASAIEFLLRTRVETPAEPPPCPHCLEAHALIDAEPCDAASGNIADRVGDVIEQLHEAWAQLATWQESCTGKHGSQQRCIDAVPAVKTGCSE